MAKLFDEEAVIVDPRNAEEEEEEEDDDEGGNWEDWGSDEEGEADSDGLLCLFCDVKFDSCGSLFDHCASVHSFDYRWVKDDLGLDFYGSFKLINYVRSQVAAHRCWSCGLDFGSNHNLQNHLHVSFDCEAVKTRLGHDEYLKPFLEDDSLLFRFDEDGGEDDCSEAFDHKEFAIETEKLGGLSVSGNGSDGSAAGLILGESAKDAEVGDSSLVVQQVGLSNGKQTDERLGNSFKNIASNNVRRVNESYFGAYSSFGIHKEMLSDKVRMDAYSQAILGNPALFNDAVVMDVGCGTGILSLFSAQAGASEVIAVEASEKMAAVATQITKDNHLWHGTKPNGSNAGKSGVVKVVNGMVEELDRSMQLQPQSVDVLLSEWMGYCLLYESMLSSVLFARDRWLKPGGAILPDTATIFAAGFGKGATSLPFWEIVYGFDMSCVGKELAEDAARYPIVDVVKESDLVTKPAVLQAFDLSTMKPDEVDFTASVELEPCSAQAENGTSGCYGLVLWFETGFTSRFCKEKPAVLSTSPYTPKTHWAQTILTFREPIEMSPRKAGYAGERPEATDRDRCPSEKILARISIARAPEHRSIDISLEAAAICSDGRKITYPVQIFNLS